MFRLFNHENNRIGEKNYDPIYFGRKSFGKIMGISAIIMMIMTMIGPVFAGTLFDRHQDYTTAFVSMAILGAVGSVAFLFAKKPIHPSHKSASH